MSLPFRITNDLQDRCSIGKLLEFYNVKTTIKLRRCLEKYGWVCSCRKKNRAVLEPYVEGVLPLEDDFIPLLGQVVDYSVHTTAVDSSSFEDELIPVVDKFQNEDFYFIFYDVECTFNEFFVGVKLPNFKTIVCSYFGFFEVVERVREYLISVNDKRHIVVIAFNDMYDGNMLYHAMELQLETIGEAKQLSDEIIARKPLAREGKNHEIYRDLDFSYNPLGKIFNPFGAEIKKVFTFDMRTEVYTSGSLKYHCALFDLTWSESIGGDIYKYNALDVENMQTLFFLDPKNLSLLTALCEVARLAHLKHISNLGMKLITFLAIQELLLPKFIARATTSIKKAVEKVYTAKNITIKVDDRALPRTQRINLGHPYIDEFNGFIISAGSGGLHYTRKGYFKNVWLLDFTSFYPNILLSDECLVLTELGKGRYRKLLDRRVQLKKANDLKSNAYKTLLNSVYGHLNNVKLGGARGLTEMVTAIGQSLIIELMREIEPLVLQFIDVNTDGIVVSFLSSVDVPILADKLSSKFHIEIAALHVKHYLSKTKNNFLAIMGDGTRKVKGGWIRGSTISLQEESESVSVGYNVLNLSDLLHAYLFNEPLPLPKILKKTVVYSSVDADVKFEIVNMLPRNITTLRSCSPNAACFDDEDALMPEALSFQLVKIKLAECYYFI